MEIRWVIIPKSHGSASIQIYIFVNVPLWIREMVPFSLLIKIYVMAQVNDSITRPESSS